MPESTAIIVKNETEPAKYIKFIETKLDKDIGYYYWKKYVAAAFWSQVSTPINLTITILTGLTTAQATSPDLIPEYLYAQIAIATLVITTLNTFFRPHTQLTHNTEMMQKWNEVGIEFEKVYYGDICRQKVISSNVLKNIRNSKKRQVPYGNRKGLSQSIS